MKRKPSPPQRARNYTDEVSKEHFLRLTQLPEPTPRASKRLPRAEWDFRDLATRSPEECLSCLSYELAREIPLWRQMIFNQREQVRLGLNPLGYLQIISTLPYLNVGLVFAEWPNTPWLALPLERRRVRWLFHLPSALFADLLHPLPKPSALVEKDGKLLFYSDFQVDLHRSDAILKRHFDLWLTLIRESTGVKGIERRGKRSATDVLRTLGAYRLLKAMKWTAAKEVFGEAKIEKYKEQSAWDKARMTAKEDIKAFASNERYFGDVWAVLDRRAAYSRILNKD